MRKNGEKSGKGRNGNQTIMQIWSRVKEWGKKWCVEVSKIALQFKEGLARPLGFSGQSQPSQKSLALQDWHCSSSPTMHNHWLGEMRKCGLHTNVIDFRAGQRDPSSAMLSVVRGLLVNIYHHIYTTTYSIFMVTTDPQDLFSHSTLFFFFINTCHICNYVFICKSFNRVKIDVFFFISVSQDSEQYQPIIGTQLRPVE